MISPEIARFLQERIDANDFPSAVYLVAEKGEIVFQDALGYAVVEPEKIPATMDTIYDLASLTKPLVTGLLAAMELEGGRIEAEQIVEAYMPELISFGRPEIVQGIGEYDCLDVTISELLTHRSAYQAWRPFYLLAAGDSDIRHEILRLIANKIPPQFEPDVIYSDLNFLMLAGILEKIHGNKLDDIFKTLIVSPLGLQDSSFGPTVDVQLRVAASEKGNEYEKQTCLELGYLKPGDERGSRGNPVAIASGSDLFRNYQIWGEVHDGNAWFMGGVAGHAGLFSTAEDTFKIAQQFLPNYTTLLKPETCELFRTNFTPGMNEHRSFAFQLASTPESTAGSRMSPEAFGHLGFTGTSLWIDPVKERVFILLTNRTHAHPPPFTNINSVRRRFHDLANELLDKLSN